MSSNALQLEIYMIPTDEWDRAPKEARELAEKESASGASTGIAKHPEEGWFVLQTCGQGPIIIWSEDDT